MAKAVFKDGDELSLIKNFLKTHKDDYTLLKILQNAIKERSKSGAAKIMKKLSLMTEEEQDGAILADADYSKFLFELAQGNPKNLQILLCMKKQKQYLFPLYFLLGYK